MTVLKELFGEKQYNLLYSIIKKADSDFHQLVFGDNWSADDIEDAHNSIQTLYLMMETIE
jgi:hypothetical protein